MGRFLGGALAVLGLIGCSGADSWQRAAVEGEVTLDGAPLASGTIRFVPHVDTNGPAAFAPIVDGRYSLSAEEGPATGRYTVEITSVRKTGSQVTGADGRTYDAEKQFLPSHYNVDSTLEADIKPEGNLHSFELHTREPRDKPRNAKLPPGKLR